MALITRISRLFSADVNAVIDRLEEPDLVLKQALRDMQDAAAVTESRVRALQTQIEQLTARRTDADEQLSCLDDELAVCLDAGDDDLARNVLRRKLGVEAGAKDMAARDIELKRALAHQVQICEEQQQELESIRQKTELFDAELVSTHELAPAVSAEQVEIALLKEKQRRQAS